MMIHWMDQIKELLNAHKIVENRDNCGPLQEITFWKHRSSKLSEVSKQLQKPEVRHILDIGLLGKSLFVQKFCQLATEIQVSSQTDTLLFLKEVLTSSSRYRHNTRTNITLTMTQELTQNLL